MSGISFTLLAIMIPILLGATIGLVAGNVYVGLSGSVIILAWIAGTLDNSFITGIWALALMIMAIATARQFITQMMGDTA